VSPSSAIQQKVAEFKSPVLSQERAGLILLGVIGYQIRYLKPFRNLKVMPASNLNYWATFD